MVMMHKKFGFEILNANKFSSLTGRKTIIKSKRFDYCFKIKEKKRKEKYKRKYSGYIHRETWK